MEVLANDKQKTTVSPDVPNTTKYPTTTKTYDPTTPTPTVSSTPIPSFTSEESPSIANENVNGMTSQTSSEPVQDDVPDTSVKK